MGLDSKTRAVAAYSVDLALYSAKLESRTYYSMHYPQRWDGILHSRDYPEVCRSGDCSGLTGSWIPWAARRHVRGKAGIDVMNGQSWKAGFTGTMLQHGAQHHSTTSTANYHPGRTHIFYGDRFGDVTHTAIFVGDVWCEPGTRVNGKVISRRTFVRDAVVSHGRTAGPEVWRYNYRYVKQARAYPV